MATTMVVLLCLLLQVDQEVFKEDPKEGIDSILEEALHKIGKLDMSGARHLLEQVLEKDPNNTAGLTHLFNIDKLNPQSEAFHKTSSRLLLRLCSDAKNQQKIYDTYVEYTNIAKRLRLHPDLLFRMSSIFSAQGHLEESEKIMAMLLQKYPKSRNLPTGISRKPSDGWKSRWLVPKQKSRRWKIVSNSVRSN